MNLVPLGADERYPGLYSILEAISIILEDWIREGERQPHIASPQSQSFSGIGASPFTVLSYLRRICEQSGCSNPCFVLMLVYIDRLKTARQVVLNRLNIHRLIITGIMVAAKYFDDQFYYNPYFAKVGGVTPKEINTLEVDFLFLLSFNCHVKFGVFARYYNTLINVAVTNRIATSPLTMPHRLPYLPYEEPMPTAEEDAKRLRLYKINIIYVPFVSMKPKFKRTQMPQNLPQNLHANNVNRNTVNCVPYDNIMKEGASQNMVQKPLENQLTVNGFPLQNFLLNQNVLPTHQINNGYNNMNQLQARHGINFAPNIANNMAAKVALLQKDLRDVGQKDTQAKFALNKAPRVPPGFEFSLKEQFPLMSNKSFFGRQKQVPMSNDGPQITQFPLRQNEGMLRAHSEPKNFGIGSQSQNQRHVANNFQRFPQRNFMQEIDDNFFGKRTFVRK